LRLFEFHPKLKKLRIVSFTLKKVTLVKISEAGEGF